MAVITLALLRTASVFKVGSGAKDLTFFGH